MELDNTSEADVRDGLTAVQAQFGQMDIIVNRTGIAEPTATKILDYSLEDFKQVIDVNLHSSLIITK